MIKRLLVGGLVGGVTAVAARLAMRTATGETGLERETDPGDSEPVLGYDGMDRDVLIDWLERAKPDTDTLRRIDAYERMHHGREAVLEKVSELMNGQG